jgi:hypothetical protein
MDIKQTGMNTKFVYSHDGKRIQGIEFDVSIEVTLDLPTDSTVKWEYAQFLNETYEQAKRRIKSVSFGE